FTIAGCGPDILINIVLTCLGFFPGHIHAFYLEYIFLAKRKQVMAGLDGDYNDDNAPFVFSERVNKGQEYGTTREGMRRSVVEMKEGRRE
ncbi:hypothetical protein LTR56_026430, partial [Elasticomyces elasticus]